MRRVYDPSEHDPPLHHFDPDAARAFVRAIVREVDDAFLPERGWPVHPEDRYGDEASFAGVYCGSAGTMWALDRLARTYDVGLAHRYASEIEACEAAYRRDPAQTSGVVPSYFLGTVGIMTARYALTADESLPSAIARAIGENAHNPTREALWGSSGTAIAALLIRERDGNARFDDGLRATHDELWNTWEAPRGEDGSLWMQDLYGSSRRYVGAAHGAAGNLVPFVGALDLLDDQRRVTLRERIAALLETYAIDDGDACNWWSLGEPRSGNRMQWCHGAPGIIIALARYPADDARVEDRLIRAGRGIWRAGPVAKSPSLCHGTAGNGFALLRLAKRTGDDLWVERAERFAADAIAHVGRWRATFGMPSASLWTGDVGVAMFVDAVLRRDPAILSMDAL